MSRQSDAVVRELERQAAAVVKFCVLGIDAKLRRSPAEGGTPVDTGHARANWVPSIGEPHRGEVSGPGPHDAGVARVLAYKLGDGDGFLSNGVPYILRLNDGYSAQAPAGFIERAIDQVEAEARAKFGDQTIRIGTASSLGADAAANLAEAFNPLSFDGEDGGSQ